MAREPQPACPMRDAVDEIERSGVQPPPLPAEVVDELVEQLRATPRRTAERVATPAR